jgi:predicted acylesterase/phospholipase RssA
MFQAVEIDGEAYWDGGYSGNPTITPLVRECESTDTILVQINPIERMSTPRSATEILNRLNEVSFNAVLLKELRMIAVLRRAADPADKEGSRWAGDAHPPDFDRDDDAAERVLETDRGMGFSPHAARRGTPVGASVP